MSDDLLMEAGKHGITGLGSGTFAAWLMHAFKSRKEDEERQRRADTDQKIALAISSLTQKVDLLVASSQKHESTGERVALLERDMTAVVDRLDALVAAPPKAERRRK